GISCPASRLYVAIHPDSCAILYQLHKVPLQIRVLLQAVRHLKEDNKVRSVHKYFPDKLWRI
ncbi:hypothetical protein, partial [Tychonema sp. LEGE 07203]|uniref:hypothetical protein n=1 Tax=Tychonema sp. LEGE 07203 TaxID=1828671 RepID=UPI001D15A4AF